MGDILKVLLLCVFVAVLIGGDSALAVFAILMAIAIGLVVIQYLKSREIKPELSNHRSRARAILETRFLVEPCSRCQENEMELIDVSPNARSIQYRCSHCGKKMRAAAASPDATDIVDSINAYHSLLEDNSWLLDDDPNTIHFTAPFSPLPFEQTTRSPIPEVVRHEVWRRDGGQCVNCGSKENLQFDHIIPVAKGGATTARNLQLLCRSCNLSKGTKI